MSLKTPDLFDEKTKRPRASRLGELVCRALLLLTLWQGPIPWWHSHALFVSSITTTGSTQLRCNFCRHLRNYHNQLDVNLASTLTWHMHWILPYSPSLPLENGSPREDGTPRIPVQDYQYRIHAEPRVTHDTISHVVNCDRISVVAIVSVCSIDEDRQMSPLDRDSRATTLSLSQRLPIYRC